MPTFATNPALEAATVANAAEDTPRLVYADWLDEHGDPDRAEFIRVQCRLADLSPAEPEWFSLREQLLDAGARLSVRHGLGAGELANLFEFRFDLIDDFEPSFHRGFPHFVKCRIEGVEWFDADGEPARVAAEVARLVRTTTVRAVSFDEMPVAVLTELLAEPALAELTGFACYPDGRSVAEHERFYRKLASSPAMRRVQHLALYTGGGQSVWAAALAGAKTFDAVRGLGLYDVRGTKAEVEKLTRAAWFRRLRSVRCYLEKPATVPPMIAGLGELPDLHTLDLPAYGERPVPSLVAGKFRALARLVYSGPLGPEVAKKFAKARFPSLVSFTAEHSGAKNDGLTELLKAPWFERLRELNLSSSGIGNTGLKALAAHPVAQRLRALKLGENEFGKSGLAALAKAGAFPELGSLDLYSYHTRRATPADLAAFLSALQLPRLRHLNLEGWPLGNAGAKALAGNPAFAGLTRLVLSNCNIGDPGARAIIASPHLQNLVELDLSTNSIRAGADALADPAVMPRLGVCKLERNRIPEKVAKTLERDGMYFMAYRV